MKITKLRIMFGFLLLSGLILSFIALFLDYKLKIIVADFILIPIGVIAIIGSIIYLYYDYFKT